MKDSYYHVLIILIVFVTVGFRICYEGGRFKSIVANDKNNHRTTIRIVTISFLFSLVQIVGLDPFPLRLSEPMNGLVRTFGIVVALAAAILYTLPRMMSARRRAWAQPGLAPEYIPDHVLVTWGPYRFIRHPFYLGEMLGFVAIELSISSYGILLAPLICGSIAQWANDEEKKLIEAYGDRYREYAAQTWRFVPLIY